MVATAKGALPSRVTVGVGEVEVRAAVGGDLERLGVGGIELVVDEGAAAVDVGGDGGRRLNAGDAVLHQHRPAGVDLRLEIRRQEGSVDGVLVGAPVHAQEGWVLVGAAHDRVLTARAGLPLVPSPRPKMKSMSHGISTQRSPSGLIEVHVLADVVGPGVPVAHGEVEAEHAHPLLHVGEVQHAVHVGCWRCR